MTERSLLSSVGRHLHKRRRDIPDHRRRGVRNRSWIRQAEGKLRPTPEGDEREALLTWAYFLVAGVPPPPQGGIPAGLRHQQGLGSAEGGPRRTHAPGEVLPPLHGEGLQGGDEGTEFWPLLLPDRGSSCLLTDGSAPQQADSFTSR